MRTLIIILTLIVFFSISVSSVYAPSTNPSDTPTLNDMGSAVLNPPVCVVPGSGDWTLTTAADSCTLQGNPVAPANVIVEAGAVLLIPNGATLDIDFTTFNLTVKIGSGVLIKSGGAIT